MQAPVVIVFWIEKWRPWNYYIGYFNGKTLPTITTLLVLIEKMGYTLKEFAEIFEEVTEAEIIELDGQIDERDYFRGWFCWLY